MNENVKGVLQWGFFMVVAVLAMWAGFIGF